MLIPKPKQGEYIRLPLALLVAIEELVCLEDPVAQTRTSTATELAPAGQVNNLGLVEHGLLNEVCRKL